jgi:hypothetical protein
MASNWDAFPETAIRLAVPVLGWFARLYILSVCHRFGCAVVPALDVAIVWGHWWANEPMRNANPSTFGDRSNATSILLVPEVVAIILAIIDLNRLREGV